MPQEFEYFAILTNKGTEKLAQYLQSGEKLTISWVVVGDGNGSIPMPDPGRTALVHEVWRGPAQVAGDLVNKNVIKATSVIPTDVGGWNVREIGLIDQDGELFAIANAPGYPKISIADGINNDMCVGMRVAVSNQAGINIKVDGTVIIATIQDIEECIQRHENNLHAHPHFTEPVPHVSENDRKYWSGFANTGPMTTENTDFVITPALNITSELFSLTVKTPKAFVEGDTITVNEISYTLYQGSDPASDDAFNAGEVITLNFDTVSRRCWASSGGTGTPKPLPPQISNLKGTVPEGETPQIIWTWENPENENFEGMILVGKKGSAPNSPTDGTQLYKGTGNTFTQTEGVEWDNTYYVRGFSYNSQNAYQMDATGAIASVTPSNIPEQVSDVTLTPNKSHATLSWTNPVSTNLQTVKVIQKIGSDPENPNDGTQVYEGTGTTVTVDNLQDSIQYHFGIFAIGKNGKYRNPVVKNYTPEIWPKYEYTGEHQLVKEDSDHWKIKFLTSGVLTWLSKNIKLDIFLVGGGGAGFCVRGSGGERATLGGGGGGGYTNTVKQVEITTSQKVNILVGAGSSSGSSDGGTSKFGDYEALGGKSGKGTKSSSKGHGGNGGSGGGGTIYSGLTTSGGPYVSCHGGNGGTDGNDAGSATDSTSSSYEEEALYSQPGKGQGTTTREFGEPDGELYSDGGGGSAVAAVVNYTGSYKSVSGSKVIAGSSGTATPVLATSGSNLSLDYGSGTRAVAKGGKAGGGYGGGGGAPGDYGNSASAGAQGIVIIRDARESA